MGFIIRTVATAITFFVVAYFLPQIDFDGNVAGLLVLAVIAGLVNGLIKPIIKLFSLPLTVMTLGLFGIVINAGFPPDFGLSAITASFIGAIALTIVGAIVGLVVHD